MVASVSQQKCNNNKYQVKKVLRCIYEVQFKNIKINHGHEVGKLQCASGAMLIIT